ncbi:hypothetical protein [Gulbenkiania mobilis]|nr:hypothetical protein [Gulbenkiania mobilis]
MQPNCPPLPCPALRERPLPSWPARTRRLVALDFFIQPFTTFGQPFSC